MIVLDFIVTVFQSFFLGHNIKSCLDEKSNIKMAGVIILSILVSSDITKSICGVHSDYLICINNLILMLIVGIFYRKDLKKGLTVFAITSILVSSYIILSSNVVLAILRTIISERYLIYELAAIVYVPQIALIIYAIINKNVIQSLYKAIVGQKMEIPTIIICNLLVLIVLLYRAKVNMYNQFFENIVLIMFALGLAFLIVYFQKIRNTYEEISALNSGLVDKNTELRKIKHDYGAQISYLYGLALMERNEDLKKSLKNIIDINQNTSEAVQVNMSNESDNHEVSLLQLALKPAIERGINVILDENYNKNSIGINDMELYRVVSNIVNNAIKAMDGHGTIVAKAYEVINKVVIEIGNNGPMISNNNINIIFNEGFTTKNNDDKSHGYGLSIAKELVEKYDGRITVKSTEENTVFKICFNTI